MSIDPALTDYWYQALHNPPGIAIRTDDRQLLRQRLYQARTAAVDESLDGLLIHLYHDEVCIIHKEAKHATGP